MDIEEKEPLWIDYFTEGVEALYVQVGKKPTTKSVVPIISEPHLTFDSLGPNALIVSRSDELIKESEFFYNVAPHMTSESAWEKFFSKDGYNFSYQSSDGKRFRCLAASNSTRPGSQSLVIRYIPSVVN